MMDLKKLVVMTDEKVKALTAYDLVEIFPILTDLECLMLSRFIRNDDKTSSDEYFENIGRTISSAVYRVIQKQTEDELK